jgi:hypothetical protein
MRVRIASLYFPTCTGSTGERFGEEREGGRVDRVSLL